MQCLLSLQRVVFSIFLEFLIKNYHPQRLRHLNWDSSSFWLSLPALLSCSEKQHKIVVLEIHKPQHGHSGVSLHIYKNIVINISVICIAVTISFEPLLRKVFCSHLKHAYKRRVGFFGHKGGRVGSIYQTELLFISTPISTAKTMNRLIMFIAPFYLPGGIYIFISLVAFPTEQFLKTKG